MPKLDRSDAQVHFEVSGSGPPMLLLAGFMSDSASWTPILGLLEPHFTLVRPDNRTCGQTSPWDAPVSMDIWVEDAAAVMKDLGHARFHVVGHSLGGVIGWALAQAHADLVQSLTMIGSSPMPAPRNGQLFRSLIAIRRSNAPEDTWLRVLFPWLFRREAFQDPSVIKAAVAQSLAYPHAQSVDAMELQLMSLAGTDPTPFRTAPPVPTQAIMSPDDLLVPYEDALSVLGEIPVVTTPGLGHSLHWDDPEQISGYIRKHAQEFRP